MQTRRQTLIEHLIVIGAPSTAGKSTLRKALLENRLPELGLALGLDDWREWQWVSENSLRRRGCRAPMCETGWHHRTNDWDLAALRGLVLFEYDTAKSYRQHLSYELDESLGVLQGARQISFVTLWTPPMRFGHQRYERDHRNIGRHPRAIFHRTQLAIVFALLRLLPKRLARELEHPGAKHVKQLLGRPSRSFLNRYLFLFGRSQGFVESYRCWLEYCERHSAKTHNHFLIEFNRDLRFYSPDEWERLLQAQDRAGRRI